MDQLWLKLADLAPVVGVLILFILYIKNELTGAKTDLKEAAKFAEAKEVLHKNEIKDLNNQLRETQKENIVAASRMTDVVEHLTEVIKSKSKP